MDKETNRILGYIKELEILERQNKIMLDKDGSIFWIRSAGKKLQKSLQKAVEY